MLKMHAWFNTVIDSTNTMHRHVTTQFHKYLRMTMNCAAKPVLEKV